MVGHDYEALNRIKSRRNEKKLVRFFKLSLLIFIKGKQKVKKEIVSKIEVLSVEKGHLTNNNILSIDLKPINTKKALEKPATIQNFVKQENSEKNF